MQLPVLKDAGAVSEVVAPGLARPPLAAVPAAAGCSGSSGCQNAVPDGSSEDLVVHKDGCGGASTLGLACHA